MTGMESKSRNAKLGFWTWNVATGQLALSADAQKIFSGAALDGTFESWRRSIDPEDALRLQTLEEDVRGGLRSFSFEYRFRSSDGSSRNLKSDGAVTSVDEHGVPNVIAGTVLDLGESVLSTRAVPPRWSPAERAFTWIWEQDASYRFTLMVGGEQTPVPELEFALGRPRWELPHAVPLESTWDEHIALLEAHKPFRGFEFRVGDGAGAAHFSTSGDPLFDGSGAFLGYRGTAHDISRRVKSEQEVQHARLLLQQASRLGRVGAWTLRVPDMEVEWTAEAMNLLGNTSGTRVAWDEALSHLEEACRFELREAVARCVDGNIPFRIEARTHADRGQERWLEIIGEPEPSLVGPCRRVIGAVKDVTERKKSTRDLQELNDRLVNTLESITEGFYTLDREWRFTYVNHETERLTRRPRGELLGGSIKELFPWFVGTRFHEEFERAMESGEPVHFEAFAEPVGFWVEVSAYPSAQGLAVYLQDITARKAAEDALRASEERHRLLFEVSMDALFQVEHESGRIVAANPAACEMFRTSETQMRERGRSALIAAREQRVPQLLAEVSRAGRGRGQLVLVRSDGSEFDAELSGALFRGGDGVTYASVAIRDISERLTQEREILELNSTLAERVRSRTADLEAAVAELRAFAHSLAHDLRTPIAAINALAHVLEQRMQDASEKDWQYASRIRQAGQQLDQYVEALLAHARLSQVDLHPTRVDLSALADSVLDDLRLREPDRVVATHVQPGLTVTGDATLLRMVLENLFGNAWKFTARRPDAEIRFTGERQADGAVMLCVSDNGAGFDMDYAHKLFGAFQRLHTQAEFPGTGIGLANVQRIVARHGGRVWAMGTPGAGASFCFAFPQGDTAPEFSGERS